MRTAYKRPTGVAAVLAGRGPVCVLVRWSGGRRAARRRSHNAWTARRRRWRRRRRRLARQNIDLPCSTLPCPTAATRLGPPYATCAASSAVGLHPPAPVAHRRRRRQFSDSLSIFFFFFFFSTRRHSLSSFSICSSLARFFFPT